MRKIEEEMQRLLLNGPHEDIHFAGLCFQKARRNVLSRLELRRPPAKTCCLCGRDFKQLGGGRIVAQRVRGIGLADRHMAGELTSAQSRTLQIFDNLHAIVWGEKELWTDEAVSRVTEQLQNGAHPWMCSHCTNRTCHACGIPLKRPSASDILTDQGEVIYVPELGLTAGCDYPRCPNFKKGRPA